MQSCAVLPDFAEVYSFIYCFLLLLYYRAPEIIFGATKYTTAIDICSRYVQLCEEIGCALTAFLSICYYFLLFELELSWGSSTFICLDNVFDLGTLGKSRYYRAPEIIFGATKYTTAIDICSRFLSKLKSYCRNKRYPEGSIAEGYLAEECMTFCSRYLDVETRLNRPSRNAGLNDPNLDKTYLFQSYGEPIGKVEIVELDDRSWIQAHRYVLFHHDALEQLRKYSGFIMNGFRFHTKYRERLRRTQNCGVVVNSLITSDASARDSNPVEGSVEYYGLLTDIIELDYYGKWKVVLFRCEWADANTARGIKNDQFGFIMVNFSRLIHTGEHLIDEPYVFSSQVKQVFYSKDPIDEGWYVVLRNTPRDLFDMGNGSRDDIGERLETLPFPEQDLDENIPSTIENGGTRRGRGHTLLTDLYNLNSVERVKVTRNSHGQPVGQEARLLAGYLGIIARNANMLPINYESWHNMPDSNKNQALSNIKDRFALEVSDAYIKKALGKKWRDNKSILKKEYFKKPISLEEKLQNVPPGMLRYQWEDAVRFWNSKKGEEASSGQKVGRLQLFDITHRKKDGTPMSSEAAEIMEKLKDKKAEYEATASTDSSVNFEDIDNRIINEVLGPERYGRVRFQGSGVNPTQYFGSTWHQYMPSGSQSQAEVQSKTGTPLIKGRITRDGIQCLCCFKVFALTAFEVHAGSTNRKPAVNIILDDGTSSFPHELPWLKRSSRWQLVLPILLLWNLWHWKCKKVFYGLQKLTGKPIPVGNNVTWTLLKSDHHGAENYSKSRVALKVMHECFEPTKNDETGRDVVEDVVFSRVSKLKRLNFKGFYRVIVEEKEDVVSVATLRVYGNWVAEMPLVTTSFRHRCRGLCRLLVDQVEKNLVKLGVEKLILPTLPTTVDTWVKCFGFTRMEKDEILNLLRYNLLDFQGTILCQKLLA
ncbi:hypothetical protein PVK06_001668 [Gossypium arboreum]|uniref:N-acetyltransferase domain-containing protein n=1 Tax=Gossypium arboreum TaxID=29729 RepID=A0ABR0R2N6_GOSAR|nr:hypothetical protein PVK06_001668 [Gossypium arboreum]